MKAVAAKKPVVRRSSGNVFEDIGFPKPEAERLRIMAELAIQIERYIEFHKLTQSQAAQRFGITQPRMNTLLRGKFHLFSIDSLIEMLARAGITVTLKIGKAA
jgi:predicted XRE-type DNA-binding protein